MVIYGYRSSNTDAVIYKGEPKSREPNGDEVRLPHSATLDGFFVRVRADIVCHADKRPVAILLDSDCVPYAEDARNGH